MDSLIVIMMTYGINVEKCLLMQYNGRWALINLKGEDVNEID